MALPISYNYAIECDGLYWSCCYGWTELESADRFSYEEKMILALPIGGAWAYIEEDEQDD